MSPIHAQFYKAEPSGIELIYLKNSTLSYPLHNHASVYTIGIIISGRIYLKEDNTTFNKYDNTFLCNTNDVFTIPPYKPHSIIAVEPYDMACLCIDKRIVKNCNVKYLQDSALFLLNKLIANQFITAEKVNILLNLISSLSNSRDFYCGKSNSYIQQLKNNIEEHPEKNISLDEMSRQVFVSKYYLIRCFKNELGLTPHQFQIQNRIRKAQKLFCIKPNMSEVALTTGFCDQSHFIKQFEKIVGLTPTCYKQACCCVDIDLTKSI